MDRVIEGIKESDLGILIFEISDYYTRISKIFDSLDIEMSKLSSSYIGGSCDLILKYYGEINNKFSLLKDKINIYSDDLTELIHKMNEADSDFTKIFLNFTEEENKKSNTSMEV